MMNMYPLISGAGLGVILIALRYLTKKTGLPQIPTRLPVIAILFWTLNAYLPGSLDTAEYINWRNAGLELIRSYAYLQLIIWTCLELPSKISWWPKPAKILRDLFGLAIGAVVTLVILDRAANINVVGLVTTSAVLTAVIGLAAQEALKDLFAGIMLRVECPFEEGDYLELDNHCNGWVVSLTLLSTRLRDVYGGLITLPNNLVWQQHMRQYSVNGPICRELHIDLDREYPPNEATELLERIADNCDLVLKTPAPQAIVYEYKSHAITYELEVWQEDPTDLGYDEVRGELLGQLWYALERIGQRVPYNIHEFKKRYGLSKPEVFLEQGIETKEKIVSLNSLFCELSKDEIRTIANLSRLMRFSKNEKIVSEDESGDTLYQIVQGSVSVQKRTENGGTQEVAQLSAPDFFGEMSVFNEEPRSATVQAINGCVLLEIERDDLRPILEDKPKAIEQLAETITNRRAALFKMNQKTTEKRMNELLSKMRALFL